MLHLIWFDNNFYFRAVSYLVKQDNSTQLQNLLSELCSHIDVLYIYAITPGSVIQLLCIVALQRDVPLFSYDTDGGAILQSEQVKVAVSYMA